ncbi:choline dehydrogenase-like flavoprotein/nucleoside-diphosphate-sugar epimerase [Paraburkholderia sp. GAS333]|uniref:GMC oxidoreductase n=1 Tax=Paraburkholderia sp. GAS333 TaxID=3156279 RepID=UPI003D1C70B8
MTLYVDLEKTRNANIDVAVFDILIVGAGAAGLTLARELSGQGLRLLIVESGSLEETQDHEALNAVEVDGVGGRQDLHFVRDMSPADRMKFRVTNTHIYDFRCRVFGGSAMAWSGEVAQFDVMDFYKREWVAQSGWPLSMEVLAPYMARAAQRLGVNPLLMNNRFWLSGQPIMPPEIDRLTSFSSYFWQIPRSLDGTNDAMRIGKDFRKENHHDVTVFLNATASAIRCDDGKVTGVQIISSMSGNRHIFVNVGYVVIAAGAVENARILLLSKDNKGTALGNKHDVVGRYLMDHPTTPLGSFSAPTLGGVASMFGVFTLVAKHRAFMYSHGLSVTPIVQEQQRLTNMAVRANACLSSGNLIQTLARHVNRNSARKIEYVNLDVVCEQPPLPQNRVTLSRHRDLLGLQIPKIAWDAGEQVRRGVMEIGALLAREFQVAGIGGFQLSPSVTARDPANIFLPQRGHSSGTTRMGLDVASSVVDPNSQVHEIKGLYAAGTSVFPTSGHVDPTLMTIALSIRLADHLRECFASQRLSELTNKASLDDISPLVLVTGATGNLGTEIVTQLLAKGYRVRGQFHRRLPTDGRVEWVQADFSKIDQTDADLDVLLGGVSAVIHLAASRPGAPAMHVANEVNLERLVRACVRNGIKYLGHASSIAVYGSPTNRLITESNPLLNLNVAIDKQFFENGTMREYARSKRAEEAVISKYAQHMHVDLYRIAMVRRSCELEQCLAWGRATRIATMYRNSHYISPHNVARAVSHLLQISLNDGKTVGIDAFNIADIASPTYRDLYHHVGRQRLFYIPLFFDLLKGLAMGKRLSRRLPIGFCRIDNSKLRSTGFNLESDWHNFLSVALARDGEQVKIGT